MRRALLLIIALAVAALAAAASAAAPAPVSVRLVSCSVENHDAVFYARMQEVPGATRMAMRFTLLEETGDRAKRVKVPGLRRWRSSKPGVKTFGYRQGIRNLPENATLRVTVEFRWYAEDGTEVARAKRRSGGCRQFLTLPNLVARITGILPTSVAGVVRYEALVTNNGKAGASSIPVRLTVDGDVIDTVTLTSLAPGERTSIVIRGPRCRRLVKLEADPRKAITETSDADNLHELSCTHLR
jgi:CARDB